MKISTILDHIDNGHMALPEFQRGYVWNGDQVRGLFKSMYLKRPVGGLLVWATESSGAQYRGDGTPAAGIVKLLLDGQQRITSLYGVARGQPPKFFDGNAKSFSGLRFHLENETFEFFQPVKMKDDALWVDVSALMKGGPGAVSALYGQLATNPATGPNLGTYIDRVTRLLGILEIDVHVEEVTGVDKTLDVVVDIFNQVNSGGTKLSKGDLALATICARWPDARDTMKAELARWRKAGYDFNLDWLLRSVNTVLTGEAQFQFLHDREAADVQDGLKRATKHIDTCLNSIGGRLGLDHDGVFFGRYGVPVMVRYLDRRVGTMSTPERDKLLFWYVQAAMWGRFSGSTETYIDQDLAALEKAEGGIDALIDQLRLWRGGLRVEPGHFTGWSTGARFYPLLYLLTRMRGAQNLCDGLSLNAHNLGMMNRLEVHHVFPKSLLYQHGYSKPEVNALGNYCFLTKECNLLISNRHPEEYFPKMEAANPGVLRSQWIPTDPELWKVKNYRAFLASRKALLADALNATMEELLHGDLRWLSGPASVEPVVPETTMASPSPEEDEEAQLQSVAAWMASEQLEAGVLGFELADPETGRQTAVLDLAWPDGIQTGLSEPVALVLNEPASMVTAATNAGFRCFTSTADFRRYVEEKFILVTA